MDQSVLDTICELVGHTTGAATVCVVEVVHKSQGVIRGAWGSHLRTLSGSVAIPNLNYDTQPIKVEEHLATATWFRNHPLWMLAPYAKKLVCLAVATTSPQPFIYLAALWNEERVRIDFQYFTRIATLMSMVLEANDGTVSRPVTEPASFREPEVRPINPSTGEEAIISFLANTAPKKMTLKSKSGCTFVSTRAWKAPIKDVQIAALEGLKIVPSPVFAELVARELFETISHIYSGMVFAAVVPIPGGSSGMPRSLSVIVAERLALKLSIPCKNVLVGALSSGRSHPHKSKNLKPYTLSEQITGHVLLVDDVATTGRHLALGTEALKAAGVQVAALAWVG